MDGNKRIGEPIDLDKGFEEVAVIGAAGVMGRGISLLAAEEMARLKNLKENRGRPYRLNLIDIRQKALKDLMSYIEAKAIRRAEKTIESIRPLFRERGELKSVQEIATSFVSDIHSIIHLTTDLHHARRSQLVFEAVPESERAKIDTLRRLNEICPKDAIFLSNTSSIPIGLMDREAGLGGRIIGFHFYNPPLVQKLVELIPARNTSPKLAEIACEIGRRFGKTLVSSRDIAGFIGNGYFIRESLYALSQVNGLSERFGVAGSIYGLNRVSLEGLIRPMGIFRLLDYVGLDVFSSILKLMAGHIPGESFEADLIEQLISKELMGGQNPDGSQKNGFFQYKGREPVGVFTPDGGDYVGLDACARDDVDHALGSLTPVDLTWKDLSQDPGADRKLKDHFAGLFAIDTLGARLAKSYLKASRSIAEKLVSDGVAGSPDDVNTVLKTGFRHLYGPFNDFVQL